MIDFIFSVCVFLLEWLAGTLGMTYEAINVWIFCVWWPLAFVGLIWWIIRLRKEIKRLKANET
jgi:hypothetical protein